MTQYVEDMGRTWVEFEEKADLEADPVSVKVVLLDRTIPVARTVLTEAGIQFDSNAFFFARLRCLPDDEIELSHFEDGGVQRKREKIDLSHQFDGIAEEL